MELNKPKEWLLTKQVDAQTVISRGDSPPRPTVGMVFDRPDRQREIPIDQAAELIAANQDQLPELEWLWFDGTELSDQGLLALSDVGHLKIISVVGTNVSDSAVQQFQQTLPECRVDHVLNRAPVGIRLGESKVSWQDVRPLWQEAGKVPDHPRPKSLDVKQVYATNTDERLHFFFRVRDTPPEIVQGSGFKSFALFIDTDNDPATGSVDKDGLREGYDLRLDVMTRTRFATEDRPQSRGLVLRLGRIPDGESHTHLRGSLGEWYTGDDNAMIGYDDDGIEVALPLDMLGIERGQTLRLTIEDGHTRSSPRSTSYEDSFSRASYELD
ncbi:hypothetical protein [Bremerella sp. P1]|uniref:hypothetical protein n=1 Tax=Bremerella sp. P1 TaxID=3026424 RepID=UPI00236771D8|nr:hypothetical protein [Bremerella sp. P1]WDI42610.1 hypothetical protein PSR63_01450 [Bremerella sp. P1]